MPSMGFYLPDDSPLISAIQKRSDAEHDGKVSAYIRALVTRDLHGDPSPIRRLADKYLPSRSIEMSGWLAESSAASDKGLNEARVIAALLEGLLDLPVGTQDLYRFNIEAVPIGKSMPRQQPHVGSGPGEDTRNHSPGDDLDALNRVMKLDSEEESGVHPAVQSAIAEGRNQARHQVRSGKPPHKASQAKGA